MKHRWRTDFEWRTPLGAWRWLILGSLGVAPYACGGRADSVDQDEPGVVSGSGNESIGTPGGPESYATGGTSSTPSARPAAPQPAQKGSAGSGSGLAGTSYRYSCIDETMPILGVQRCTNGLLHRVSPQACNPTTSPLPPGGCFSDAGCNTRQLCLCNNGTAGRCVPASCHSDAECGLGFSCAAETTCFGTTRFACQTAADECSVSDDCPNDDVCTVRIAADAQQPIPESSDYSRECAPSTEFCNGAP